MFIEPDTLGLTRSKCFHRLSHFVLTITIWHESHYYCFIGRKTEVQRCLSNLIEIQQLPSGRAKVQILAVTFASGPVTLTTMISCPLWQVYGTRTYSLGISESQMGNLIKDTVCQAFCRGSQLAFKNSALTKALNKIENLKVEKIFHKLPISHSTSYCHLCLVIIPIYWSNIPIWEMSFISFYP